MEYGYYSITQQLRDEAKRILDSLSPEEREVMIQASNELWENISKDNKEKEK